MPRSFGGYDEGRWASTAALGLATLVVLFGGIGCGRAMDGQPPGLVSTEALDGLPIDPEAPYPPAVAAAIGRLADELDVAPQSIEVVSYEEVEWPNGCLGLPGLYEACTEAVTPGWKVVLSLAGEIHSFRADAVGAELREE